MKKRVFSMILGLLILFGCFVSGTIAADDPIDILCVGESLTCGSGANAAGTISGGIDKSMTFPTRLGGKLGYGYEVHNYGISGVAVLPDYQFEFASQGYLVAAQRPQMTQAKQNPFHTASSAPTADYIVVMLGTNDAKPRVWETDKGTGGPENFYNYYTEMIVAMKAIRTNPKIICVVPPPVVNGEGLNDYTISEEILRDDVSPIIERVAREQQCLYLNLRDVFPDPVTQREDLLALYAVDDGVHPNKDGYNLIAESLVPYVKRIAGDVNSTGSFNENDLIVLAKHISGWSDVSCNDLCADVNLDGMVDGKDLVIMAKYLADWDIELL